MMARAEFAPVPVVAIVSVTAAVVCEGLSDTDDAEKLHVLRVGRFEQIEGESAKVPLNSGEPVKVTVVEPDPPGAAMVMVAGAIATVARTMTSTVVAGEVELA